MNNKRKEKEVLSQMYDNEADTIKYLPLFFKDKYQLEAFIDMFKGKTLKIPTSYQEYIENYLKIDPYTNNRKLRGINGIKNMRTKILESYINLFSTLQDLLKNECGGSD